MVILDRLYTASDLEQLPDDDYRYELVRGVLTRMPPPSQEHGAVVSSLNAFLFQFVRTHDLGEVASPGNTASDMNDKIVQYFEVGVRLVWLVYPKTRTLHVYRSAKEVHILDESDTLEGEPVLPGFRLPVREVFAQLRG